MTERILDAIINEFRSGQCRRDIAEHWACRCTVPGPGMRAAGERLVRRYRENGTPEATLIPYPADDRTEFLDGRRNPLEWRPRGASLRVVAPEQEAHEICNYADEPVSLICNSHPTGPDGVEADVVIAAAPLNESELEPGQWAGKLVLSNQFPGSIAGAVHKSGALGLLSDCVCPPWLAQHPPVREPEDVPDLVMWTILSGRRDAPPLFGFNLSPRQGRRLRALAAIGSAPVRLHAVVDAERVEGSSDLVAATLPGGDLAHEEIWVLAHLSEPGARDNGSGCCLSLELARMLRVLTGRGDLPPLRRTVRFLHATEVQGFLPYIGEHRERLPSVVAGLCADSVAQDLNVCGGEMVLFLSPEHNASFVDGLMQFLLQTVSGMPARRFSPDNYATYPWHNEPFFGNDAFVSDGFFDIPTPQLSAWPDRYYHSNLDTPDQISADALGRSAAVLGTFVYLLASAGEEESLWFARLAAQDWKQRVCLRTRDALSDRQEKGRLPAEILHMGLQAQDAVTQTLRFAPESASLREETAILSDELAQFAAREAGNAARALGTAAPGPVPAGEDPGGPGQLGAVPRRLRWGVPSRTVLGSPVADALDSMQAERGADARRIWPWINGRRSVGEIAERLAYGGRAAPDAVLACLELLEEAGMVSLTNAR